MPLNQQPSRRKRNLLDLFDLAEADSTLVHYVMNNGPVTVDDLCLFTHIALDELQPTLTRLVEDGHLRRLSDGRFDADFGRSRRRALPPEIWPALLTGERLYTAQEIAALRTVIPMLQFARARLSAFNDHGPTHALRVKSFATQLGYIMNLSRLERMMLRTAALFHDVGNVVDRERHHIISQETIERLAATREFPFTVDEAQLVGLICRWHRREYDPQRVDTIGEEVIRTGLLASLLRVSDAMDIDYRRSEYPQRFRKIIEFFYPDHLPYWTSAEEVLGIRIHSDPAVMLQIFTKAHTDSDANMQIAMLRKDLHKTPLDFQIAVIPECCESNPQPPAVTKTALIAFPFETHSLIMAALSRKNLEQDGYAVELLCYPDQPDGSATLWNETLPGLDAAAYHQLVVIGDRPDAAVTLHLLDVVDQWRAAGSQVCMLNRHEANWSRIPALLQRGVTITLGEDWSYFQGTSVSQHTFFWGRVAVLCTRDIRHANIPFTTEEEQVARGLLHDVYDLQTAPDDGLQNWSAQAERIIERIIDHDTAYFSQLASGFTASYATPQINGHIEGQVLVFEDGLGVPSQAYYWALEAAIEQEGRSMDRGIHFNVPYAIALRPDGDAVELVGISHWREEEMIPIRLLYPPDLKPQPTGHEGAIFVRLSSEQAPTVLHELIHACNEGSRD